MIMTHYLHIMRNGQLDKKAFLLRKPIVRLYFIIVFLLFSCIFSPLTGCTTTPESLNTAIATGTHNTLNWQFHGTWISADGTISQTASGSISGTVHLGETGEDLLDLNITFTEDCNYQYTNPTSYSSESRKYLRVPYCVCPSYSYNADRNDSVFSYIGIGLDKEYVIFHWEDKKDLYLVASTDPDTDPKDILSYFEVFVQTYPDNK